MPEASSAGSSTVTLLTAPGTAALAVLQLRGPDVGVFLQNHFGNASIGALRHGQLTDGNGELIDDPLIARVDEDVAEISTHGGTWIVTRVLRLCEDNGFHLAPLSVRSERSQSALDFNDEHSVTAHMLAALPHAPSTLAIRWLLAQPGLWANASAETDSSDPTLHNLLRVPKVAIVGRPNAGKSMLANRLFGRERSIVSATPGTTRDWVGERADLNGLVIELIDTPGLRATNDAIEADAIEMSDPVIAAADLVIHLIDATAPEPPRPGSMVVINKTDAAESKVGVGLPISAHTGDGVPALITAMRGRFLKNPDQPRAIRW